MATRPAPLIAFLHIPKTAGSSLERILGRQYAHAMFTTKEWRPAKDGTGVYEAEESIRGLFALPPAERDKFKIIKGHFHFGYASLLPADTVYFTFLRDPVERVISTYYFALRNPRNYLHEPIVKGNLSLADFARSDLTPEITNDQVRRIAGVTNERPFLGKYANDAEMYEAAKSHLESHFPIVGLSERFDETILLLQRTFDWETPYYNRVNVGSNRPSTTEPEVIDIIRERNQYDLALYEFAAQRLDKQITEAGPTFQRQLTRFQRWNPLHSLYFKWHRRLRWPFRRK